ncbi:MAG TPA: glycosyltransferase family 2 protein [Marinobacter sp.]|uniref:glycosyltransferase family 2 protein n=1 Tax=Marinobacter sp. TaxID=50741 RepID=UPI002D7FFED2|nr:glycosyltransferase family 2 protein [Marinobacter sp.]HET8800823.1 glycosyltransferase family 2 protein [Marinobacter sp.]
MIFFVFSYNRGPHLKNCIDSIEACAPGHRVVIYDDASEDPETQRILAELAQRHEVRSRDDKTSADQHGALYTNMQRAIESVEGDEVLCFLQDDTQLVRPIDDQDLAFISDYFERFPNAGFLAPVFQKRITRQRTLDRFVFHPDRGVYVCEHRSKKQVAGVYYSDISLTTSQRLRAVDWQFIPGEFDNELRARKNFMEMGYLFAPFAMWLPNPPAYRNKKKSLAFRIAEVVNKAGLYPFRIMAPEDVARLRAHPENRVAIAEDHLSVTVEGLRSPWIFHPLRRSRLLRKLDRFEAFLKRLFSH